MLRTKGRPDEESQLALEMARLIMLRQTRGVPIHNILSSNGWPSPGASSTAMTNYPTTTGGFDPTDVACRETPPYPSFLRVLPLSLLHSPPSFFPT